MSTTSDLTRELHAQLQEHLDFDLGIAMMLYEHSRISIQWRQSGQYVVAVDGEPFITGPDVRFITTRIE